MQAVILAGGKGTRLAERLKGMPKPLVDIGGLPLLERQILLTKRYGFTHVLILVSHAAQYIKDFCLAKQNWGLEIECVDDGNHPRGTAGATLAVLNRLADEFLVMYGDTMLDVDLQYFYDAHARHQYSAATLFLHPNDHPHDSDLVELDDVGRVNAFHPYPHEPDHFYPNLVNAALYWIRRHALEPFLGDQGPLDFGKHLFPKMLADGQPLYGYQSPEYIKDCGTPTRLDKVCADLLSGRIERANLNHPQKAVFLDRDGTLNKEVGHLSRAEDFELLPGAAAAVKRLNNSDYRSVLITNQPVVARGDCTVHELRHIHAKMETLLGTEGAYLDRIYYCPHHPDRGFPGEVLKYKVDCNCRKPKPGLIETASKELNITLADSWMVGDTLVDMATAKACDLRSLLVETGFAGLDYKASAWPDYTVPDLSSAVDFILGGHDELLQRTRQASECVKAGDFVLIGGLSRSGKSNFTSALAENLRSRGLTTNVLSLDRWLLSNMQRSEGVLGRYDLATMTEILAKRTSGPLKVALPGYNKLKLVRLPAEDEIVIQSEDVVIVEGTVALELSKIFPTSHKIYIEIDEEERMNRVLREYRLRGLDEAASHAIYAAREKDETNVIREHAAGALIVGL